HLILSASGSLGAMFDARNILEMHHVSELETLVLTHCHSGHGRYLSTLFEGVKVHTLMLPDSYDVFAFEDLTNITLEAKRHGVSVLFYEANDILTFGEMTVSFLPIAKPPHESRHDGFAFTARVEETDFSCFNVNYALYGDRGALYDRMMLSDILLLSGHTLPAIDETENQSVCIAPENVHTFVLPALGADAFIEGAQDGDIFVGYFQFSLK
ncbi:MAG: hypothetical protein J6R40_00515, partial [Clostridia bacterium]|nr:hypothetical protein [Clostridia bacterium]